MVAAVECWLLELELLDVLGGELLEVEGGDGVGEIEFWTLLMG